MPFEQRELTGSLFKNSRREKDTHPNSQGSALIEGVEYWISGWTKTDKNGDPWISLAFKRKDEKPATDKPEGKAEPAARNPRDLSDISSDIPF